MKDKEKNIAVLLDQVTQWNEIIVRAKSKYQAELAPDFSLIDWLNNDELALSRYLHFLLSAEATHGQSTLFLKNFLSLIAIYKNESPISIENCHYETRVDYEVILANGRRIDLLITSPEGIIGIENKPWAADQKNQLLDYAQCLSKTGKQWKLIYLCNSDPSEYTLPAETCEDISDNILTISWHAVVDWLMHCALYIRSGNVKLFVESLVKYINRSINYEVVMDDDIELSKLILKNDDSIKSAFMIHNKIDEIREILFSSLIYDLRSKHKDIKIEISNNNASNKYYSFYIPLDNRDMYSLCWEFEQKNYNSLYFGLSGTDPDENKNLKIRTMMNSIFAHLNGKFSRYYTWWSWDLDPQGRNRVPNNWGDDGSVWSSMNSRDNNSIFAAISETIDIFYKEMDMNNFK